MSHELISHLPFSVLSVVLGMIVAGLICFMTPDSVLEQAAKMLETTHDHGHDHVHNDGHDHVHNDSAKGGSSAMGYLFLFHLFHPAHVLFSAVATTAMFYKYEKSVFKAILIGFAGSIVICVLSDAFIPSLTTKLMGYPPSPMHICILITPMQVIPFAVMGVLLGFAAVLSGSMKSTITSHTVHVVTSTMATLFYTIAYSDQLTWVNNIGTVFMMTVVAVGGICCLSDVVFPLLFTKKARTKYAESGHDHPH